ncbi:hypothetical protein JTE90_014321 [Oedothorax gibbosus]|uniref:G-protein coupled receptors family 1 profile domain-containing protein n=1 Tax=Oedothorax gibbosus TaxID=931172 RepID=A0AAV6UWB3_9ARAC|nr:hypothetical protein JTE90_014321 [Oedothorax gibbosus]
MQTPHLRHATGMYEKWMTYQRFKNGEQTFDVSNSRMQNDKSIGDNKEYLVTSKESSLVDMHFNRSVDEVQKLYGKGIPNQLVSHLRSLEFFNKKDILPYKNISWSINSNTDDDDLSSKTNTNWTSYMYYNPFVTKNSDLDMYVNNSSLEVSIDVNTKLDSGNLNSSIPVDMDLKNKMEELVNLYKIVVPVLLTACFLSFVFNLIMVCSVRSLRRKLSPTICLSLSLAMANAYASLVVGLGLIINSLLPIVFNYKIGPFGFCFVLALEAFRLGGLVVSVLHLLALAVNHYIGILRPLHYAHIVTRETTIAAIVSLWILPVVFFLVYFASIPNDGFQSYQCSSYNFLLYSPFRITTSVMFFFPLVLMTLMYSHMFVVIRQHQKGLLQCPSTRALHRNVKAVITTLLILGTYILGWMPAVLFFVLTCLDCTVPFKDIPLDVRVPVSIFINAMIVAKSFMDPVVYVVRMPEIKSALKTILYTRCGYYQGYPTPSHSRSDTRRLTLISSRRRSKLSLSPSVADPKGKQVSPNGKHCPLLARNGAICKRSSGICETVLL